MNNINNIIKSLESLGNEATLSEITKCLCKQNHVMFDSYLNTIVKTTLNSNKDLFTYNKYTSKWSLCHSSDNEYLYVSDNRYFKTIPDAMYELFSMYVPPRRAWFKIVGTNDCAWFPKYNNADPDWTNTLSDDGKIWREKPNTQKSSKVENDRHLESHLRYAFEYVKHNSKNMYHFTGIFKQIAIENDGTRIYQIVDDKMIIRKPFPYMLICNISYMKEYKGITENDRILGGGKYPAKYGDGGEKENFLPHDDGLTYGFVETNYIDSQENLGNPDYARQIHLEKFNPAMKEAKQLDGVRVVFISKGPNNEKNIVVGWYDNATVFRIRQNNNKRFGYNILCSNDNAHLILEEDRCFNYPKKNDDGSYNFGQQNVSYPYASGKENTIKLANELNDYLDSIITKNMLLESQIINKHL